MQQALIASALVIQHLLLTNDLEIMNNLQNQLTGLMKTLRIINHTVKAIWCVIEWLRQLSQLHTEVLS